MAHVAQNIVSGNGADTSASVAVAANEAAVYAKVFTENVAVNTVSVKTPPVTSTPEPVRLGRHIRLARRDTGLSKRLRRYCECKTSGSDATIDRRVRAIIRTFIARTHVRAEIAELKRSKSSE